MSMEEAGLRLTETRRRGDYDGIVEALTPELGPEFGQAMNWWCGIGTRLYELPYWKVLAAVDAEGRVQAVIGLYRETGSPADEYWVGWLGVVPAFRRKGLGALLVEEVAERARGLGGTVLKLYTGVDNSGAISFYENLGFRRSGSMAGHRAPQAGSDGTEVVFSKAL